MPKIWIGAENFVRRKFLSAENYVRRNILSAEILSKSLYSLTFDFMMLLKKYISNEWFKRRMNPLYAWNFLAERVTGNSRMKTTVICLPLSTRRNLYLITTIKSEFFTINLSIVSKNVKHCPILRGLTLFRKISRVTQSWNASCYSSWSAK